MLPGPSFGLISGERRSTIPVDSAIAKSVTSAGGGQSKGELGGLFLRAPRCMQLARRARARVVAARLRFNFAFLYADAGLF